MFLSTLGIVGAQSRGENYRGQVDSRQFVPQYSSAQTFASQQAYNPYQNQQQFPNYQQPPQQSIVNRGQTHGINYQGNRPNYVQQPQPVFPRPPNQQPPRPTGRPQGGTLENRFGNVQNDDSNRYQEEVLTTRTPPRKPLQTTDLPSPQPLDTRFDNYTSRKISWDGELSKNAEIFSLKLFAFLEGLNPGQSFMISPFSIHSLLVMIAEGAGGKTFEELNKALGLNSKERARDFHQYITTALKYKKLKFK